MSKKVEEMSYEELRAAVMVLDLNFRYLYLLWTNNKIDKTIAV